MEQYIKKLQDFTVLVRCFTFNHSLYITDALNGFTMQQTNFPYVIVLVDDASMDGEQEIIQKYVKDNFCIPTYEVETDYANITFTHHLTNHNCHIAVYYLKENHYSQKKKKAPYVNPWREKCKYEAICEGDDYWIDPLKLQKQVDVLNDNLDCMLTFHAVKEIYENNKSEHIRKVVYGRKYSGVEFYKTRPAQTASFLLRTSIYKDDFYLKKVQGKFLTGDIPLVLSCSRLGTLIGIPNVMSVYRHNEGGWSSQKRTKDYAWKIATNELRYSIFGSEYEMDVNFIYQRLCMGFFVHFLKRGEFLSEFLKASLSISVKGTIKSIYLVFRRRFV